MLSTLDLIQRMQLFALLTPEQAQWVADNAVKRRYKRGDLIVEQGGMGEEMIVLLSGRARVVTTDHRGREAILATLTAGDCIGEMSMIDSAPHSATVRTEVQCDALVLTRGFMASALPRSAGLTFAMLARLVKRLRQANRQIEALALLQLYDRVVRALQNMSELEDGQHILRRKINRQDLAKVVGASRERVSKVIKNLEERGQLQAQADGSLVIRGDLSDDPAPPQTAPAAPAATTAVSAASAASSSASASSETPAAPRRRSPRGASSAKD
jgi:CRP-like cAMP-binding protein